MAGWFSWISGRRDNKNSARDAIIGLREQLHLMAKKEEHLLTKIDDELRKAKEHVTNNKRAAQAALRQKKMYETCLLYTSPSPRDQRGSRMPSSA